VAASLLVRGDAHRHEAVALWDAASRLLGLHEGKSDSHQLREELEQAQRGWRVEHEIAENHKHDIASLQEQVAELTRQRDDARVERNKAQDDIRRLLGMKVPAAPAKDCARHVSMTGNLQQAAIIAGATDCHVYLEHGQVTVVVDDLRHGRTIDEVANAVFSSVSSLDGRTYIVRTTGPSEARQERRWTPGTSHA
jgi:seryl-tRNA synthetase